MLCPILAAFDDLTSCPYLLVTLLASPLSNLARAVLDESYFS
jgi:hypothetical protein